MYIYIYFFLIRKRLQIAPLTVLHLHQLLKRPSLGEPSLPLTTGEINKVFYAFKKSNHLACKKLTLVSLLLEEFILAL